MPYYINDTLFTNNNCKLITDESFDKVEKLLDEIILENKQLDFKLDMTGSRTFNLEDENSLTMFIEIKFDKIFEN